MDTQANGLQPSSLSDDAAVRALYQRLLDCWNKRDAGDFAALFARDGNTVGFGGSPINGQAEIESVIALYQNTPAQFHGRSELLPALTEELRQLRST